MACKVKARDGKLAYRLFWNGMTSWEGTGLRDTPVNGQRMQARADTMAQEIRERRFDYLHWFPEGNKAHLFRSQPSTRRPPPMFAQYVEPVWLPRKQPPAVRASLEVTYRKHWTKHIKPVFGALPFSAITTAALTNFRGILTNPEPRGKGLKMKTARDIIDGTLRAMYRDARKVDKFVTDDPFVELDWPRKIVPAPDPFTAEERDLVLDYFWRRKQSYYPFVHTLFFTGLRTGEAVGLRWGRVNLRRATIDVRVSRTLREDNPPKTTKSERTITLRPEVVSVLRAIDPLRRAEDTFVFTSQAGNALDGERFVEKHWRPALRAVGVKARKLYATRHTFISLTLMAGIVNIKALADYCGTSIEMIDKHYASWMGPSSPAALATLGGTAPRATHLAEAV